MLDIRDFLPAVFLLVSRKSVGENLAAGFQFSTPAFLPFDAAVEEFSLRTINPYLDVGISARPQQIVVYGYISHFPGGKNSAGRYLVTRIITTRHRIHTQGGATLASNTHTRWKAVDQVNGTKLDRTVDGRRSSERKPSSSLPIGRKKK